ncbi:hypothetical protein BGZ83_001772 [Gryganskiella cystojenkinii]|nr:hypothetical protein BGZ83_001772 [Gryganskiella cystojenkinii]
MADCRDAYFIRNLLIVSSALHGFVFLFGFWLLIYRNRGLNHKIVSELFVKVGTGVRPKPMDCIIFFTAIASLIKIGVNLPLIFDVWRDRLWLRIAIEQTYWIFVAIGFSSYFVGLLYAMPVTAREGVFAVYQPETAFDTRPLSPIHVLTPTTVQKNFLLLMGALYPTIFGAGAGVASAIFAQMEGHENLARILLLVQYSNWVLILWSMAIMFFYYGLKYTFILRANIIIAEAALKAPRAAFGIGNLRSASPARFLFIQLQITGFGGSAVTVLAGTLCMIWVMFRDKILRMEHDQLPHTMAFFWTCAIAAAFFVIMALIAVQSVRNRRRGLHDPSSSFTNSIQKSTSGNGSGSVPVKGLYSSPKDQKHSKLSASTSTSEEHLNSMNDSINFVPHQYNYRGSSSVELSDKDSVAALVMATRRMDYDAFSVSHQINKMEVEKAHRSNAVLSPKKPLAIMAHPSTELQSGRGDHRTSESSNGHSSLLSNSSNSRPQQPDLRHTVFGSSRASNNGSSSPPPSTSSSSSSSFPLLSLRRPSHPDHAHNYHHHHHPLSTADERDARLPFVPCTSSLSASTPPPPAIPERKHSRYGRSTDRQQQLRLPPPTPPMPPTPPPSIQYNISTKGLSPPPRAKRLPTNLVNHHRNANPDYADDLTALPPPQFTTSEPGRNTFMGGNSCAENQDASTSTPQYSDTPRIGGGVRRKSIKEADDVRGESEPTWPLPPTLN